MKREELLEEASLMETQSLVDGYFDCVKSDFPTGLGALYAYERQTPEIAVSKIKGLKDYYDIDDQQTLKFFSIHADADVWHREECANLIADLNEEEQEKAMAGAEVGAKLLWGFLDGMMNVHKQHQSNHGNDYICA